MSSRQQPVHFEERASTLGLSTATANGVIGTMRNKMKSARKGIDSIESFDPLVQVCVVVECMYLEYINHLNCHRIMP